MLLVALPSALLLTTPMGMQLELFLVAWTGMVGALMVPSLEPFLALYAGSLAGLSASARFTRPLLVLGPFVALWVTTGAAAWALLLWSADHTLGRGALVAVAGLYQLSPVAGFCLGRCRSPMGLLMQYGARAHTPTGAVALGARYALICLGCCAGLWIALVGAGAMTLSWMAALALLVFIEKWHPQGEVFARASGALLLVLAIPIALGVEFWTDQAGLIALAGVVIAAGATLASRRRAVT